MIHIQLVKSTGDNLGFLLMMFEICPLKKKKGRKKKENLAQHESGEPNFIWGKKRTVAQKTESHIALRSCSKKVEGGGQYL